MRFEILLVGVKKDYFLMKAEEVVDVAMVVTMVVVVREGAVVSRPHKNIMISMMKDFMTIIVITERVIITDLIECKDGMMRAGDTGINQM